MRESWKHTELGAHIDLLTGYPFKSAEYTTDGQGIRLLRGDNVGQGSVRWDDACHWPEARIKGLERYQLQEGDLVVALDRTWVKAGLKAAAIQKSDLPCLLVQRVARIRGTEMLDQGFLAALVNSHRFIEMVKSCKTETAVPHISPNDIRDFVIELPPLPEQRGIANALHTWDTAIQKTEQLIEAQELRLAWTLRRLYEPKPHWTHSSLGAVLAPTKRLHGNGSYDIGSVGKRGIRLRSEIYSKNLSANYAGNILVEPGWVCFGLSTDSIAYGVNRTSNTYSVSPAYRTFEIKGADPGFIDGFLRAFNTQLSKRFLIISARQGKAIDFDGLLNARCDFPPIGEQRLTSRALSEMQGSIEQLREIAALYRTQKRGLMQMLLTGKSRLAVPDEETA